MIPERTPSSAIASLKAKVSRSRAGGIRQRLANLDQPQRLATRRDDEIHLPAGSCLVIGFNHRVNPG